MIVTVTLLGVDLLVLGDLPAKPKKDDSSVMTLGLDQRDKK